MRRGAQYKVYSTVFNTIQQVSLILYSMHAVRHDIFRAISTREPYRPNDRPRSTQRPIRHRSRICPCAARCVRNDQAAKRPDPMRQWLTRSTERPMDPYAASKGRRRRSAQERAARSLPERPSGAFSSTTATTRSIAIMPPSWPRCWQPLTRITCLDGKLRLTKRAEQFRVCVRCGH